MYIKILNKTKMLISSSRIQLHYRIVCQIETTIQENVSVSSIIMRKWWKKNTEIYSLARKIWHSWQESRINVFLSPKIMLKDRWQQQQQSNLLQPLERYHCLLDNKKYSLILQFWKQEFTVILKILLTS